MLRGLAGGERRGTGFRRRVVTTQRRQLCSASPTCNDDHGPARSRRFMTTQDIYILTTQDIESDLKGYDYIHFCCAPHRMAGSGSRAQLQDMTSRSREPEPRAAARRARCHTYRYTTTYVHFHMYAYVYVRMHACMHARTHAYVCVYVCMDMYVHVCM